MKRQQSKTAKAVNKEKQPEKTGHLLNVSDANYQAITKIALHFKCSHEDALDIMLNSVEFEITETAKPQIEV